MKVKIKDTTDFAIKSMMQINNLDFNIEYEVEEKLANGYILKGFNNPVPDYIFELVIDIIEEQKPVIKEKPIVKKVKPKTKKKVKSK